MHGSWVDVSCFLFLRNNYISCIILHNAGIIALNFILIDKLLMFHWYHYQGHFLYIFSELWFHLLLVIGSHDILWFLMYLSINICFSLGCQFCVYSVYHSPKRTVQAFSPTAVMMLSGNCFLCGENLLSLLKAVFDLWFFFWVFLPVLLGSIAIAYDTVCGFPLCFVPLWSYI